METGLALTYNGTAVLFDRETGMGSLTAMWQACGAVEHKRPNQWLRTQSAQELIKALERRSNMQKCMFERVPVHARQGDLTENQVVETRPGNAGGTMAHWQIATAYAHYLNPDFYLAWNEYARAYLEGRGAAASVLEQRVAALEARVAGRKTKPKREPVTADRVLAALEQLGGTASIGDIYVALLPDVSTDQLFRVVRRLRRHGLITHRHGYYGEIALAR